MSGDQAIYFFISCLIVNSVLSLPVWENGQEEREKTAKHLTVLVKPTHSIRCHLLLLSQQFKHANLPAHDLFGFYDQKFRLKFSKELDSMHIVKDTRFLNAMKMIQSLVGLSQDLQVTESRINGFDETQLVSDFRKLEYLLRDLVEGDMRKVAFEILDDKEYSQIPAYSVGGLFDAEKTKNDDTKTAIMRNRIKMDQIDESLKLFINNVLSREEKLGC